MEKKTLDTIYNALTDARKQLNLWMKSHGHDIASQETISKIDEARDLLLEVSKNASER